MYVFDADGRIVDSSPVLLGAAPGDDSVEGIGTRPMHLVRPEEKTTPAGRFVAEAGRNTAGEDVVWVDHDCGRLDAPGAPGRPRRSAASSGWRRPIRPSGASPTAASTCPVAFFESVVWPLLRTTRAVAYVLPETRSVDEVFAGLRPDMKVARAQPDRPQVVKISRQ